MVHIDKVEIYGFKSFGFKNTVVKMEPGLVSISGANGSGKSSILDAIIFAMGEKSPKTLRVDRLSSIVHDMNSSRGRTPMARVSLHLDNQDHRIPVDSNTVVITRVMDEKGESMYYINKQKSTRSHLYNVLEACNASLGQLNVVQQGTIPRIAEFSADEKRGAIEDLLGLSYFDEKKKIAMDQLQTADSRLAISTAKMGEIRKRITELEGERNHMIRSRILNKETRKYQAVLDTQNLAREKSRIHDMETRLRDVRLELKKYQISLETIQKKISDIESEKILYRDQINRSSQESAAMNANLSQMLEEHSEMNADLKSKNHRLLQVDQQINAIRAGFSDIAKQRYNMRSKNALWQDNLAGSSLELDNVTEQLENINKERDQILKLQSEHASKKAESDRILESMRDQMSQYQDKYNRISSDIARISQDTESARDKINKLAENEKILSGAKEKTQSWISHCQNKMATQKKHLENIQNDQARIRSRTQEMKQLLERAKESVTRYDSKISMVQKVMHEDYAIGRLRTDAPDLGVLGLAYELVSWPPSYERAVMASASDWLKALVVQDIATMEAICTRARALNLSRLRIIPLDSIQKTKHPETDAPLLSEQISCDARFESLRSFLFGGTVLAESLQQARLESRKGNRAVTLRGECVESGSHIIDWDSRISNLTRTISMGSHIGMLQKSIKTLQSLLDRHYAQLDEMVHRGDSISQNMVKWDKDMISAQATLQSLVDRLENNRISQSETSRKISAYDAQLPKLISARDHARDKLQGIRREIDLQRMQSPAENAERMAAKLHDLNQSQTHLEKSRKHANQKYHNAVERQSEYKSKSDTLMRRAADRAQEHLKMMHEQQQINKNLPSLKTSVRLKEDELKQMRQKEQDMIQNHTQINSAMEMCDKELESLRKKEKSTSGTIHTFEKREYSISADLGKSKLRADEISKSLPRGYRPDIPPDTDVRPLIASLQAEHKSLPPLNANAPSKYDSISSGYRSMSDRKNILEQERDSIIALIDSVEKDKRQTYLDAFDIVDREIRSIFSGMSGANAWLELENEDDVFNSGITYMVQFPGKPKRTSASLSGGEKTLAAIVFILALQKLKPSPFYIFDEVDAHLDAPNSEKLAKILAERSQNSQFLVVSLKEFVVEKAGLIYGVYPKNGVSQVINYRDRRVLSAAR